MAALSLVVCLGLAACIPFTERSSESREEENASTEDRPRTTSRSTTPTPTADDLEVVNSGFGRRSYARGAWWYAVILNNPNSDRLFTFAQVTVEAIGSDGTILDSSSNHLTILPGEVAVSGVFFEVGEYEIDHLDVRGPVASESERAPSQGLGEFTVSEVSAASDSYSTKVGGVIAGTFAAEQENVEVVVIASDPSGTIIGGELTFVDRLPVDGRVRFEVTFLDPLPDTTAYAAYPNL